MPAAQMERSLARPSRRWLIARNQVPLQPLSENRSARLLAGGSCPPIIGIPIQKSIGIPISRNDNLSHMNNLGKRIRALRTTKGLTQKKLALRIGIQQSSLSELETGESKIASGDTLVRLAEVLECSPDWLATGKGSPVMPLSGISPDESDLLLVWRYLSEQNQELLLHMAHKIAEGQRVTKSIRSRPTTKAR